MTTPEGTYRVLLDLKTASKPQAYWPSKPRPTSQGTQESTLTRAQDVLSCISGRRPRSKFWFTIWIRISILAIGSNACSLED